MLFCLLFAGLHEPEAALLAAIFTCDMSEAVKAAGHDPRRIKTSRGSEDLMQVGGLTGNVHCAGCTAFQIAYCKCVFIEGPLKAGSCA